MRHAFALVLIFGPAAFAAPVPKHLMKDGPVSYYPVAIGTKLIYSRGGFDEERVIAKVEATPDGRVVTTEGVRPDGTRQLFHKVLLNAKGVFVLERAGFRYSAPLEMIRLPFKADEKWDEVAGDPQHGARQAIREERIKVPAGEFSCIRIESGNRGQRSIHWYAAGIGVVKVDYGDSTLELKSITPGK